ncbi:hypothetical protein NE237_016590 [Protea cynaroides]|uniref:16S rRNA (uracil(1498)-N(3))-methyltransferase n=1 Tax=Protea cynaroides TaxID=273540 RepID=A0A9Q0K6B7_9MAGN|nr:hypothetical protein NE237_016590 [Protea cynaroides]
MQNLVPRQRFADILPWRKVSRLQASSMTNYPNQSRGGLPRFYSKVLPPSKGSIVRVLGDEFWHITKVLRMSVNDRIELFNGAGGLVKGCVQRIDQTGLDFMALEDPKVIISKSTQWHVFAAFGSLKGGRADWLVEKCTELGASSVTPLLTERSALISENRVERLQRVILASVKQSQRLHRLTLNPPIKVSSLLSIVAESKLSFVAVAEATPLISVLDFSRKESNGLIIIGPEGDFTEEEVKMMIDAAITRSLKSLWETLWFSDGSLTKEDIGRSFPVLFDDGSQMKEYGRRTDLPLSFSNSIDYGGFKTSLAPLKIVETRLASGADGY